MMSKGPFHYKFLTKMMVSSGSRFPFSPLFYHHICLFACMSSDLVFVTGFCHHLLQCNCFIFFPIYVFGLGAMPCFCGWTFVHHLILKAPCQIHSRINRFALLFPSLKRVLFLFSVVIIRNQDIHPANSISAHLLPYAKVLQS